MDQQFCRKPSSIAVTSTSQSALELVAAKAVARAVVRRNTYCLSWYSSPVRNFCCSAWNRRTTSPCNKHIAFTHLLHLSSPLQNVLTPFKMPFIITDNWGMPQHAVSRPDQTRPDQTRPDQTRPDQTRPDQTRPDQTRPDQTRPDQTRPDQTRPDQTRPDQTRPDQTRLPLDRFPSSVISYSIHLKYPIYQIRYIFKHTFTVLLYVFKMLPTYPF